MKAVLHHPRQESVQLHNNTIIFPVCMMLMKKTPMVFFGHRKNIPERCGGRTLQLFRAQYVKEYTVYFFRIRAFDDQ